MWRGRASQGARPSALWTRLLEGNSRSLNLNTVRPQMPSAGSIWDPMFKEPLTSQTHSSHFANDDGTHFLTPVDRTMFIVQLDGIFLCFLLTRCYGELADVCSVGKRRTGWSQSSGSAGPPWPL